MPVNILIIDNFTKLQIPFKNVLVSHFTKQNSDAFRIESEEEPDFELYKMSAVDTLQNVSCTIVMYKYDVVTDIKIHIERLLALIRRYHINFIHSYKRFDESSNQYATKYTQEIESVLLGFEGKYKGLLDLLTKEEARLFRGILIETYDMDIDFTNIQATRNNIVKKLVEITESTGGYGERALKKIDKIVHFHNMAFIYKKPYKIEGLGGADDTISRKQKSSRDDVLEEYATFLAYIFFQLICNMDNFRIETLKITEENNLSNVEFYNFLSRADIQTTSRLQLGSKFQLGGMTLLSKYFSTEERYLLSVPFRDYNSELDKSIRNSYNGNLFNLFKENGKDYVDQKYIYFDYSYNTFDGYFSLHHKRFPNFETNLKSQGGEQEFQHKLISLLPMIHSTIFYEKRTWEHFRYKKSEKKLGQKTIKVLILLNKHEITGSDYSGLFTIYLWWQDNKDYTTEEIEKAIALFYAQRFSFLENAARNALIPLLTTKLTEEYQLRTVSQIIARNFSHHIGSHIQTRARARQIRSRIEYLLKGDFDKTNLANMLAFVDKQKSRLDDFIVQRNEFLADPLKSSKAVRFYQDIILPFTENVLMMDNLAASEAITYIDDKHNRLKIRVFIKGKEIKAYYTASGKPEDATIIYPDKFPYFIDLHNSSDNIISNDRLNDKYQLYQAFYNNKIIIGEDEMDDITVALPHEHCFYSILENIIRNAAKHNKSKLNQDDNKRDLTISIKIDNDTKDENYYLVEIFDDISEFENDNDWEEFKKKEMVRLPNATDNIKEIQNFGILDIKVCTQILTGKNKFSFDSDEESPLRIDRHNGKYLKYIFKIQKERKICWIGPNQIPNAQKNKLRQKGIFIFDDDNEFLRDSDMSTFSYRSAIIDERLVERLKLVELEQLLLKLPFRVLVNPSPDTTHQRVRNYIQKKNFKKRLYLVKECIPEPTLSNLSEFFDKTWKQWFGRWPDLNEKSVVLFHTRHDKAWEKAATSFPKDYFNLAYLPDAQKLNIEENEDTEEKIAALKLGDKQIIHTIFDHHGVGLDENYKKTFLDQNCYIELSKSSKDFNSITQPKFPQKGTHWSLPYEMLEAGLMKILILDERLAAYAHNRSSCSSPNIQNLFRHHPNHPNSSHFFTNFDLAWAANIGIATHLQINDMPEKQIGDNIHYHEHDHVLKVHFNPTEGFKFKTNFHLDGLDKLTDYDNQPDIKFDFIILHRTLLNAEWLNDISVEGFIKSLQEHIGFVVVESGGTNLNINYDKVKFISYNELASFFTNQSVAKYSLTQRLLSLKIRI